MHYNGHRQATGFCGCFVGGIRIIYCTIMNCGETYKSTVRLIQYKINILGTIISISSLYTPTPITLHSQKQQNLTHSLISFHNPPHNLYLPLVSSHLVLCRISHHIFLCSSVVFFANTAQKHDSQLCYNPQTVSQ